MYSILEKNNGIIKFLAESDDDLVTIIDACKPGSTVEVLAKTAGEIHTFIKNPSGQWVIYKGESNFTMSKNDAKVSEPNPKDFFQGSLTKKIEDYQKGVKIHKTGLVTGTLLNATVEDDIGYDEGERKGHYFTAALETPKGAESYDIYTMGINRKTQQPCDKQLTVRMENMTEAKKIKIVYNTGEEFEFILDQLILE